VKVLAALSGGVDSSVAAARAVDAGHDVTGVHLALSPSPESHRNGARGCCTLEDARDARRAADVIGIPFYVWDLAERFRADVVDDFVAEYAAGRTPNPCIRCNEQIKFAAVLDRALALGFDAVCTGHYARLRRADDGTVTLHRAVDESKDQSYVLGGLTQDQLRGAMFPVGDSPKAAIRAEAEQRGLLTAAKPDSHDVCFIPHGDTAGWLRERIGTTPGPVVDRDGRELGRHSGAHQFTVGQRRGLGAVGGDGQPRYVLSVEPSTATVVVGTAELLSVRVITGERPRWTGDPTEGRCLVQVRAHGEPVPGIATIDGDAVVVSLDEPMRGVAPGQALVLYDGDRVLGSATICSSC
jgi:tRNA-specific 2-thiouridylase